MLLSTVGGLRGGAWGGGVGLSSASPSEEKYPLERRRRGAWKNDLVLDQSEGESGSNGPSELCAGARSASAAAAAAGTPPPPSAASVTAAEPSRGFGGLLSEQFGTVSCGHTSRLVARACLLLAREARKAPPASSRKTKQTNGGFKERASTDQDTHASHFLLDSCGCARRVFTRGADSAERQQQQCSASSGWGD